MDELKWELLTEIQGRVEAEILRTYFSAYGIEVELFQESLGQRIYPTALDILGNVQIFVAKKDARIARKLLKEYYNPIKRQTRNHHLKVRQRATRMPRNKFLPSTLYQKRKSA